MLIISDYVAYIIFFIAVHYLYFYFAQKAKYWQKRGVSGPKPIPILGNLLDNVNTPQNVLEEQRLTKYGRIYGTMLGWKPAINIGDPDILKQIMVKDFKVFMNHAANYPADDILSKMLPELNGNDWRRMKTMITPAFTSAKLKAMQPLIECCVQKTFKYLTRMADKEIDMRRVTLSFTLNIVAECIFGIKIDAHENPNDEFVVRAQDLVNFRLWRIVTRLTLPFALQAKYDLQVVPKNHVNYFVEILKNVINQRRRTKTDFVDFVTLLLEAECNSRETDEKGNEMEKTNETGNGKDDVNTTEKFKLTETEIIAQCFATFVAGYETTANFLYFTLYALATNPKVQEKLYNEIQEYFESCETPNIDSLNALPYLDAVVNESLRHYSPLTIFEHICGEDYKIPETGVTIEKGTIVNLSIYAMHHDPILFPNPHQFLPERFLPENKHSIRPYSFIPFGCGPRMCIGNRFSSNVSKLFLAHFVNKFEVIRTEKTPSQPKFNGKFIILSCEQLHIRVKCRHLTST